MNIDAKKIIIVAALVIFNAAQCLTWDWLRPARSINNKINNTLMQAAKNGNIDEIKQLLSLGADVNTADKYGWTPLMMATQYNHILAAQLLLSAGAKVNAITTFGWTTLFYSAQESVEITKLLLDAGADVNVIDQYGQIALDFAIIMNNVETTQLLLAAGANVNHPNGGWWGDRSTPLMLAARDGHTEIVKLLLAAGADASKKNRKGKTALDLVHNEISKTKMFYKYSEIAEMLCNAETDMVKKTSAPQ